MALRTAATSAVWTLTFRSTADRPSIMPRCFPSNPQAETRAACEEPFPTNVASRRRPATTSSCVIAVRSERALWAAAMALAMTGFDKFSAPIWSCGRSAVVRANRSLSRIQVNRVFFDKPRLSWREFSAGHREPLSRAVH